jgi:hypothetical protein
MEVLFELSEYVHGDVAAACVTVNVWPPTLMPADRDPPVLAATEYAMEPFPVPLDPDVMVSQPALLLAVHAQPLPADTVMLPEPPDAETDVLVELIE